MSDAEKRQAHEAKVAAAWADLSLNPSWQTVFEDLQRRFKLLDSSFTAEDNYHATAAAIREGEKNVIRWIAKKHSLGLARTEDETTERKREAK